MPVFLQSYSANVQRHLQKWLPCLWLMGKGSSCQHLLRLTGLYQSLLRFWTQHPLALSLLGMKEQESARVRWNGETDAIKVNL